MSLTFDEAIENHRQMWNWIADETEKRKMAIHKQKYFKENEIDYIYCDCYCCQYAIDNSDVIIDSHICRNCEICPIDWGIESENVNYAKCCDYNALYNIWRDYLFFNNWKSAAKCAKQIANLPARKN